MMMVTMDDIYYSGDDYYDYEVVESGDACSDLVAEGSGIKEKENDGMFIM